MARRQLKPYRQGQLDGLCGVYALINALRLLCPRLDEDACERAFCALIRARARQAASPLTVIHAGLSWRELLRLIGVWQRFAAREFGISLTVSRLRVAEPSLRGLWRGLCRALDGDERGDCWLGWGRAALDSGPRRDAADLAGHGLVRSAGDRSLAMHRGAHARALSASAFRSAGRKAGKSLTHGGRSTWNGFFEAVFASNGWRPIPVFEWSRHLVTRFSAVYPFCVGSPASSGVYP